MKIASTLIGLRFEETPASTILPAHRTIKLKDNMTMTLGHTILAIPGFGGIRFEDVYLVTSDGGKILHDYPVEPEIVDSISFVECYRNYQVTNSRRCSKNDPFGDTPFFI
jgi:hypothetical protein